ncbi:MAG: tyrosine-type recombinase/integrase [Candidatus Aminicenantes bacterium]|nr:tyrosine-type recombinase/integrase [Candidatus Aminicenantes bacterium]
MKSRQSIIEQVQEYLKFRRSCGYQLEAPGKELMLFARYAVLTGHKGLLTTELTVRWAKLPQDADPRYWATRYDIVRRFAEYRFLFDPATEIPPKGLLGPSKRRLSPHIYSDEEITALLQAASQLTPTDGLHPWTYVTLFGLLVSTGLRISEALNLSRKDADLNTGVLTIKETKFRKSRLVPAHASTLHVLRHYSKLRDSCHPGTRSKTFFLSEKGTPLNYRGVLYVFLKLRRKLGWQEADKKPRIHDFRHTFTVRRLLKWYKEGANLDQKILALSTYLGHVQVTDTYWYLSAVPELLAIVSDKFENFGTKERRRDTP